MRKAVLFLVLATILTGVIFFWNDIFPEFYQAERKIPALVQEVAERISSPPPLIVEVRLPESFLTKDGVLYWTNIQRVNNGLPALAENQELNLSALLKTQDMLAQQYFGHISPQGEAAGDLALEANYEFVAIGENLALGDFEDDQVLVQGWMDSPGHRANILNSLYREIGVAVLRGEYQGRVTWLAVQHFGKPLSACRQPLQGTLKEITENQEQIEVLYFTLTVFETEIRAMRPKRGSEYNQKVEEYNVLVVRYNALIEETKILVESYNAQVQLFNECAQEV